MYAEYTCVGKEWDVVRGRKTAYFLCEHCGMTVIECSNPDCQHEFKKGDSVFCSDGKHYCDAEKIE